MTPPLYIQRLWQWSLARTRSRDPASMVAAFAAEAADHKIPVHLPTSHRCQDGCGDAAPQVWIPGFTLHADPYGQDLSAPIVHLGYVPDWWETSSDTPRCAACGGYGIELHPRLRHRCGARDSICLCDTCAPTYAPATSGEKTLIVGWSPHHPSRTLAFAGRAGDNLRQMLGLGLSAFYERFACVNIHEQDLISRPGRTYSAAMGRTLDALVLNAGNVIAFGSDTCRALELSSTPPPHTSPIADFEGFPLKYHPTGRPVLCLPHPSSLNQFFTNPTNVDSFRRAIHNWAS